MVLWLSVVMSRGKRSDLGQPIKRYKIFYSKKIFLYFWIFFISKNLVCILRTNRWNKKIDIFYSMKSPGTVNQKFVIFQGVVWDKFPHQNKKALSPFYHLKMFLIGNECKAPYGCLFYFDVMKFIFYVSGINSLK